MAWQALLGAALGAGTSIFTNAQNQKLIERRNREERDWNEGMYNLQRKHALEDRDWQAEYNSPEAQMNRFKQAGLNPNLVYGNVNMDTPTVRASSVESYNPQANQVDLSGIAGAFDQYMNLQARQAQIDNMHAQRALLAQEVALKAAQTLDVSEGQRGKKFENDMKSELRGTLLEFQKENLRKLTTSILVDESVVGKNTADVRFTLDENLRKEALQAPTLQDAIERVGLTIANREESIARKQLMKEQLENAKKDGKLKDYEVELSKAGLNKGDNMWFRALVVFLNKLFGPNFD